jgi:hypothetical protein
MAVPNNSDNSDCYFFVCKLISALAASAFSILSLIYGILALTAGGPFQAQNVTFGVIAVVLSVTGVCGLVSFMTILLILATIPIIITVLITIITAPSKVCFKSRDIPQPEDAYQQA